MDKYYFYIILTRPRTFISKMVQFTKHDEYTHAAISLDKELNHMYGFGRKNTYNPFIGAFKHENFNEGLYKFSKVLPGTILELEVTKEQYERGKSLLNHFIANSDKYKYSYLGLFYCLVNKPAHYQNRFLCSEFVYYILNESGIVDLKMPRNLVRPQNLLNLEKRVIFEGNLKDINIEKANCILKEKETKLTKGLTIKLWSLVSKYKGYESKSIFIRSYKFIVKNIKIH